MERSSDGARRRRAGSTILERGRERVAVSAKKLKIVGVIPARLNSERLPGKVLLMAAGRAMVHHVYEGARGCPLLNELLIATDSPDVRAYCEAHRIPVVMTADSHRSGTERIHEVMQRVGGDVFVNLQGDEPLVTADHVRLLIEPFLAPDDRSAALMVTTLKVKMDAAEASNPNVVKVVADPRGRALYFSRAPIPYRRDADSSLPCYKHLGFYAYRAEALARYVALPPSPLEKTERLEQLRFLENGISIYVAETAQDTVGVDTAEDWQAVCRVLAARSLLT
jgi:3-deoxy-manno-octulosonate cytidylyltransferase (CMP-KDO synthetase)